MRLLSISLAAAALIACGSASTELSAQAQDTSLISAELPQITGEYVWTMDKKKSALTFVANHGGDFTGTFSHFDAAIKLNPNAPEDGSIHAIVDLSSIDAGDSDRNANLPLADWFDMKLYPTATFISNEISKTDAGYAAGGTLSIKGISQDATLSFTLTVTGNTARAIGGLTLDRRDFKLGESADFANEDWVKFPVIVKVDITARS